SIRRPPPSRCRADRAARRHELHRHPIHPSGRLGSRHCPLPEHFRRREAGMNFAVGSLVKARDREWVVLPPSTEDLLLLRLLGGPADERTGIYLPLERVDPARFELPDPTKLGDFSSCRLLRDAVRLGFRASAGPFRSFAQLAVEPRPYQLVPLLMAL